MRAVLRTIRILVITSLIIKHVRCQDGFSNQDLLRLQQMADNDGQIEAMTSYSSNIIQRDPSTQSMSSVNVQYHMTDDADKSEDYNRADRGRSRKVYRIKNPFQRQLEHNDRQQSEGSQDGETGASNQYAAMQYSLPPDDFLQKMRVENQYYQQQQQQQQEQQQQQQQQVQQQQQQQPQHHQYVSTPAPSLTYTATPQPQYQYSTINPSNYDDNHPNQIPQLEPKISHSQSYHSNNNPFQFNGPNSYQIDVAQSTPSPHPPYLSTPNNQYIGTPANPYVSSSSPVFLSSQPNLQQYVSSPISVQSSSLDYNNNRPSSTIGNQLNYENDDYAKKIQIDHYDNSANGIRYPPNPYQHEYQTPTPSPSSSPFPDPVRDNWQNTGVNSLSKSLQEVSLSQYPNSQFNQQDSLSDAIENSNSDTHRVGNLASANNVYMNFVQPDYRSLSNIRNRIRDIEQETGQPGYYSHGDYGWKMADKRPYVSQDNYASGNFPRHQIVGLQSENGAVSQMSFHMDTGKPHNYDQTSKSASESLEAQEFAKAAAKAHEQLKQQQMYEHYQSNYNNNQGSNLYYSNNDKKSASPNPYSYSQPDLITVSPYYYQNARDHNVDSTKTKQPFDHAKALKNIVPIDVSNVVPNSDNGKTQQNLEDSNRYAIHNYNKDINEHNLKQYYKQITDSYYKDKNTGYGYNIKAKPDEITDELKQLEQNIPYYGKQQTQSQSYNHDNKRYIESSTAANYLQQSSNNYQDNIPSANIPSLQRPQNQVPSDIASILKLNDIPYRLTQGLSSDQLRLHNGNFDQASIPTPLPGRLNQNVGSHQIDVASDILSKLIANKQQELSLNRPDIDPQTGGIISTINGYRVANPFNVDLKLVAEMLKGKTTADDTHLLQLRDQFSKLAPIKFDVSQLQHLFLKNDNYGGLSSIGDGLSAYASPYIDIYNNGRFPYQGVKYSRSQEEEESIIPIADASNTHPIGAVIEQDDVHGREVMTDHDLTAQGDDAMNSFTEQRPKRPYGKNRAKGDRHRHPNSILPGRHSPRNYPKSEIDEPYPLLKPPPQSSRSRGSHVKMGKHSRRRRINKSKSPLMLRTEPLFHAESSNEDGDTAVPTLLMPPAPVVEAKSDDFPEKESS